MSSELIATLNNNFFDNGFIFIVTPTTQGLCVPLGDLFYERYFLLLVFQLFALFVNLSLRSETVFYFK